MLLMQRHVEAGTGFRRFVSRTYAQSFRGGPKGRTRNRGANAASYDPWMMHGFARVGASVALTRDFGRS